MVAVLISMDNLDVIQILKAKMIKEVKKPLSALVMLTLSFQNLSKRKLKL